MAVNYVQKGKIINLVAAAVVTSGSIVVVNATSGIVGIAVTDAAIGGTYAVQLGEVWRVPAAAADVIAVGDKLYYDAGGAEVTIVAGGNTYAGYAFSAKAGAITTVNLMLNGHTE